MSIDFGKSQLNRLPRVPANIPDAFEMEATDQKTIMMSLRRFDRNGAKDYDIQMDQTVKLTASTHTWNFYRTSTTYGIDGPKEEFTLELQLDDYMKQSTSGFIKIRASVEFMGNDSQSLEESISFMYPFVFRPNESKMTVGIQRKWFERVSRLDNYNEEQITVTIKLTVEDSNGFRNRSKLTYDFSSISDTSDLKMVFSDEQSAYINGGYLAQLSSYFVGLRRRLSELPKDDCGLPFETFSDIYREEFVTLLRIVYPSNDKLNEDNVPFLLPLADRFLFEGLL